MQAIDRYRLETHNGPYASWPSTSHLIVDGRLTTQRAPGYVIEAQYRTPHGDVLITSYDCPFEESNAFVLLDAQHRCVAKKSLGGWYASFLLHAHWPINASTLVLHYAEALFFTLSVLPPWPCIGRAPRLRLRRVAHWQGDERMRASHRALQQTLDRAQRA